MPLYVGSRYFCKCYIEYNAEMTGWCACCLCIEAGILVRQGVEGDCYVHLIFRDFQRGERALIHLYRREI